MVFFPPYFFPNPGAWGNYILVNVLFLFMPPFVYQFIHLYFKIKNILCKIWFIKHLDKHKSTTVSKNITQILFYISQHYWVLNTSDTYKLLTINYKNEGKCIWCQSKMPDMNNRPRGPMFGHMLCLLRCQPFLNVIDHLV